MIQRLFRYNKLYKDNKGSAIVMVVIALAFISILGVTIMWMSMSNYRMKATDQNNKQGFYTAETVLEQIRMGLQSDASVAANSAYSVIMQNYSDWSEAKRESEFKTEFKKSLVARLQDPSNIGFYSIDHLAQYIDTAINISTNASLKGTPTRFIKGSLGTIGEIQNVSSEGWIILKGITLEYTDDEGFYSEITTDIMISAPDTAFVDTSSLPPIFKYALIADQGLEVGSHPMEVDGSIYAGGGETGGIDIGRNVKIYDSSYVVSNGPFVIENAGSTNTSIESDAFYVSDIAVNDGVLNVKSNTRVADDLTLSGRTAKVNMEGTYIGFGNSMSDSVKSSAIVINGTNADLNMSGLSNLIIAGHSFIGTGKAKEADALSTDLTIVNDDGTTSTYNWNDDPLDAGSIAKVNSNVMMGESVAVKGNQLAYLIPDECIAINGNQLTDFSKNPMTLSEWHKMSRTYYEINSSGIRVPKAGFSPVAMNKKISSMGGNMLSDYAPGGETDVKWQTVFAPSNGQTLVYFYIKFADNQSANSYATDYYRNHKDRIDNYISVYADNILLPASRDDVFTQAGTVSRNKTLSSNGYGEAHLLTTLQEGECTGSAKIYTALCSNLTENMDALTSEELSNSVYNNIVVSGNGIRSFTGNGGTKKFKDSTGSVIAIVTDAQTDISGIYDGSGTGATATGYEYDSATDGTDVKLILATHDVVLDSDFSGIVIAGGKIYINGDIKLVGIGDDSDKKEEMIKVLQQLYDPTGADPNANVRPIDFFKDGDLYIASSGSSSSGLGYVDINNSVMYQNWIKR